jgi:hypothetical protein
MVMDIAQIVYMADMADAPTTKANEAVQIGRSRAAVPFSPRSDQQPFPPPPRGSK